VAVTPDGQRIVTGSLDTTARVWDARTGQTLVALKGHTGQVTSVAVTPDGQRIVTGSLDTTARVWDARTGQTLVELKGHTSVVTSVAVTPDGQQVVTRDSLGEVFVWDSTTGNKLAGQPIPPVLNARLSTLDGGYFFYPVWNRVIRIPLKLSDAERQERFARTRSRPDLHRMDWQRYKAGDPFAAAVSLSLEQRALAQGLIDRGLVGDAIWHLVAAEVLRPRPLSSPVSADSKKLP
jgi:WD40 repeat protein